MFVRAALLWTTFICLLGAVWGQCCQQLNGKACVKCPNGMHLYRANCIFDLHACTEYHSGFDCSKCSTGYTLIKGTCTHTRLGLDVQKLANFTVYMQSGVKPNLLLNQVQAQLASDLSLWKSWLNHTAYQRHRLLSPTVLAEEATAMQTRVVGSNSLPLYIYLTSFLLNGTDLTVYRLTFQVQSPWGFADVLVAAEGEGEYVEILEIKLSELDKGGWRVMDEQDNKKFEQAMGEVFSAMAQQIFLQGFWLQIDQGYNVTLFFMDNQRGVAPYVYILGYEDLSIINITTFSSNDQLVSARSAHNRIPNNKQQNTADKQGTIINTNTSASDNLANQSGTNSAHSNNNGSQTYINQNQTDTNTSFLANKTTTNLLIVDSNSSATNITVETIYKTVNSEKEKTTPTTAKSNDSKPAQENSNSKPKTQNKANVSSESQTINSGTASGNHIYLNQSTSTAINVQSFLELTQLSTNPLIATGYAVSIKGNYIPPNSKVQLVSLFRSNSSYCLYFYDQEQPPIYYKLIFCLNITLRQIQIVYYTTAKNSLVPPRKEHKNIPTNNSSVSTNNSSDIAKVEKQTEVNSSSKIMPANEIVNRSNSAIKNVSEHTNMPNIKKKVGFLSNSSQTHCPTDQFSNIDVTGGLGTDIFLAKINLLLLSMYGQDLLNCVIKEARYSWVLQNLTIVNSILYNITYASPKNDKYLFEVQIQNNEIRFISVPTSFKESGTLNPNNSINLTVGVKNANKTSVRNAQQNGPQTASNSTVHPTSITSNKTSENNANNQNSQIIAGSQKIYNNSNESDSNEFPSKNNSNNNSIINPITNNSNFPHSRNSTNGSANNTGKITSINASSINATKYTNSRTVNNFRQISSASYISQPQYKSIIQIVRSIKRVPANATVTNFTKWTIKSLLFYEITFQMNFSVPLSNGASLKTFIYNVDVNSSSYLTIINTTILYNNLPLQNTTSTLPLPSSLALPPNVLQSFVVLVQSSPYTQWLSSKILSHSPGLVGSEVKMLSYSMVKSDFGGMRSHYNETLRFQKGKKVYCFQVNYEVLGSIGLVMGSRASPPGVQDYVTLREYQSTNCSEENSNRFIYNLTQIKFNGDATYNKKINLLISKITEQREITYITYQQFQNYFIVELVDPQFGNIEMLIDGQESIILIYSSNPKILYTPSESSINSSTLAALTSDIKTDLGLNGTMQIVYMLKLPYYDGQVWPLHIYTSEKKVSWGLETKKYYNIQGFYNKTQKMLAIVNTTLISLRKNSRISINFKGLNTWHQISSNLLLEKVPFTDIMTHIQLTYVSFLENSHVKFLLAPTHQDSSDLFNSSYLSEVTLKLILSKQYTQNYYGTFALTIGYTPLNRSVAIKAVEAIPGSSFDVLNCDIESLGVKDGLPLCQSCAPGYRKVSGGCAKIVSYCSEYFGSLCIRCKSGAVTDSYSACQNLNSSNVDILAVINVYLLGDMEGA